MRQYEKAEPLYLEAKVILEKALGKEHPLYATSLYNLASLYSEMGQYEKAEPLYLEAKAIWEKALGKEHPDYGTSMLNLATLYWDMGQYEKAEPLHLEAKAILEKALGKEHPDYTLSLNSLASLYETQSRFTHSEPLLKEYFELTESQLSQSTVFLSERELANYAATFQASGNKLSSYLLTRPKRGGKPGILPALSYDQTLFQKGFLLTAASRLNTLATSSPETEELYNQLKSYRRRLAAEISKPIAERKGVEELEEKANDLEKDLARSVAGYGEAMRQVKWDEVRDKLQSNEAAIEFVHFQYYDKKATDSTLYAALVLRPGWEQPKMVYLCEQRQLDSLLNETDATAAVQKLYATRGVTPGGRALSPALYRLLWQPLDSLLEDVTTVHFSPSGSLHRIAFNAIPTPPSGGKGGKGEVLADRYKLNQLFSTRSLVVQPVAATPEKQAATLFGGISYETNWSVDSTSTDSTEIAYVPHSTSLLNPNRSHRGDGWSYLPGTKQEVDRLSKLLAKQGFGTAAFTDTMATEERFKQLGVGSPSPAILHIATHGFFFPDPALKKSQGMDFGGSTSIPLSEHPLMRSGLLLAGANKAWKEGKPFPGREDGILTAYEIAQVNLTSTKLAVLSACETGLGDIQGSEGVMGLQRSLKMAGVEKLIVSLWAIPDKESAVFMEMFYTKWLAEGKEIRDAFYETQRWMRKRYKNPLVWAGFVLVE
jgi:CHAT domain-containing protein